MISRQSSYFGKSLRMKLMTPLLFKQKRIYVDMVGNAPIDRYKDIYAVNSQQARNKMQTYPRCVHFNQQSNIML